MSGTDLVRLGCGFCDTEWDCWGADRPGGFVPDDPDTLRCPSCLRPATAVTEPEDLT